MPQINILNILQGDNQSTIVDKINYNFDQILSAGGGPQGQQGLLGPTGPIGPQGAQGTQGIQGPSGTKWFVQDTAPASGAVTGSSPWAYPSIGDYWLDPDSANQEIWVFTATGWVDSGYGLSAGDIFQKLVPIYLSGGGTGKGIFIAGTASDSSLVLSDGSVADYSPGGSAIENANWENSKLKIATDGNRQKLISFGRSNYDTTSGTGGSNSSNNPSFQWTSVTPSGTGDYNLTLVNPGGSIAIQSTVLGSSGGVNIYADSEVSAESAASNIQLKTSSNDKGTFIDTNTVGGFLEVSDNSSTPSNQPYPSFYVNATGAGIGVGTGQFKYSGDDARRLAVLGNVSISKTQSKHTAPIFTGTTTLPANNNKGTLYVEGFIGIGATGPSRSNTSLSDLVTTGAAEAQGAYPPFWAASPNYGPVLQIKTHWSAFAPNLTSVSRTILGDGVFDGAAVVAADKISGTGPDLTQEYFVTGAYPAILSKWVAASFQQKISTATNVTGTSPQFAITTFGPTAHGLANYSPTASYNGETVIQTRNGINVLTLMANGTVDPSLNKVNIGARGNYLINIKAGDTSNPGYGNVKIGNNAGTNSGVVGHLPGNINFPFASSGPDPNHSLIVSGTQTIGTDSPLSSFTLSASATGKEVSNYSTLKIFRNLYEGTVNSSSGFSYFVGPEHNNYPNGLEIVSDISDGVTGGYIPAKNPNKSVAIAVGARKLFSFTIPNPFGTSVSVPLPAPTDGFFVSNSGQSVSIGNVIDPNYGLKVTTGASGAILTNGDVDINGNVGVTGNFGVTGDVDVIDPNPASLWSLVAGATVVKYASDFSGGSTTTISNLPSAPYDRIINIVTSTNGPCDVLVYYESSPGTFSLIARCPAYSSCMAIIPAGRQFRIKYDGIGHSGANPTLSLTLMKFGK